MSTTLETAIDKLFRIAEAVALEECEAVEDGQQPCPLQSDNQVEWCLTCLAKKALAEYLNANNEADSPGPPFARP